MVFLTTMASVLVASVIEVLQGEVLIGAKRADDAGAGARRVPVPARIS